VDYCAWYKPVVQYMDRVDYVALRAVSAHAVRMLDVSGTADGERMAVTEMLSSVIVYYD
jgi:hypothetical protein